MGLTINLSPCLNALALSVSVSGTVVSINDVNYDLSELPDGASVTHGVIKKAKRVGDDYAITLELGYGANAPEETRFPAPIVLENHNGPVELPPYNIDEEIAHELA